jgi:hypothetical protein
MKELKQPGGEERVHRHDRLRENLIQKLVE